MPYKAARHPRICDIINDVKLFPTVYRRIYCRKFLTLPDQKSHYNLASALESQIYVKIQHSKDGKKNKQNMNRMNI